MATKKMTKAEILKQIKLEEEKIKKAEQRKNSYEYKGSQPSSTVKTKPVSQSVKKSKKKKPTPKPQPKQSEPPKLEPVDNRVVNRQSPPPPPPPTFLSTGKSEPVRKVETSNEDTKPMVIKEKEVASESKSEYASNSSQTEVRKGNKILFCIVSLTCGILLIALIVIVMIGISSG